MEEPLAPERDNKIAHGDKNTIHRPRNSQEGGKGKDPHFSAIEGSET